MPGQHVVNRYFDQDTSTTLENTEIGCIKNVTAVLAQEMASPWEDDSRRINAIVALLGLLQQRVSFMDPDLVKSTGFSDFMFNFDKKDTPKIGSAVKAFRDKWKIACERHNWKAN